MKAKDSIRLCAIAIGLSVIFSRASFSDTLVLGSRTVTGTVLQTNGDNVLLMTDYGALAYSMAIIKEIKIEKAEAPVSINGRLPDAKSFIVHLSKLPWASNLKQIPATVIDKGIMKNVPYVSYRCGGDYEANVYGDLDQPAGLEVGVYHELTSDATAKRHCIEFVISELTRAEDKKIVQTLDLDKDLKTSEGVTFEITPPSDHDSYGGWWVSVYSPEKLATSRASDSELNQISVSKSQALTDSHGGPEKWTAADLAQSRPHSSISPDYSSVSSSSHSGSSPFAGSVYVRGYTRKDGTYVEPHTRSAPHRR